VRWQCRWDRSRGRRQRQKGRAGDTDGMRTDTEGDKRQEWHRQEETEAGWQECGTLCCMAGRAGGDGNGSSFLRNEGKVAVCVV